MSDLILSGPALSQLSAQEQGAILHGLTPAVLDAEINAAISKRDKQAIEILTTERILRAISASGESVWSQVRDLLIKQQSETWRVTGYSSFGEYYNALRLQIPTGEADPFWLKRNYGTWESYATILRHYYERHQLELADLSRWGFARLQVMNSYCAEYDAVHDGQLDPDVERVLSDFTISKEQLIDAYRKLKKKHGLELKDNGAELPREETEEEEREPDHEPNPEAHFVLWMDSGELSVFLETVNDAGVLQQVSHTLGSFRVTNQSARPFIDSICRMAKVEVR